MVPKHQAEKIETLKSFRAVLFRMVPKHEAKRCYKEIGFRAVLFRMVPKLVSST